MPWFPLPLWGNPNVHKVVPNPLHKRLGVLNKVLRILLFPGDKHIVFGDNALILHSGKDRRPFSLNETGTNQDLVEESTHRTVRLCDSIVRQKGGFSSVHNRIVAEGNRILKQTTR